MDIGPSKFKEEITKALGCVNVKIKTKVCKDITLNI